MKSTTPAGRVRPWVWAAALGAAALVGAGGSLVAAPAAPDAAPSSSEAALGRAHDDASRLAAAAGLIAGAQPSSSPTAAHAAEVLRLQAAVLARSLPRSERTPSATGSASSAPTASSTPVDLASGLSASATARLADLAAVDPPTAALLASLAAAQRIEADLLAQPAGQPAPTPPSAIGPTDAGTASPPVCPSQAPSAAASGTGTVLPAAQPTAQSAVQTAEQAAVWTYTVLAARTDAAARAADLAAADFHRSQLRALDAVVRAACTELPAADPGFALPADVGRPGQLAQLEGGAAAAWSDLVGSTEPALRPAAAAGLIQAARRSAAVGALSAPEAAAFPGHLSAQAAAAASGTSASASPDR